MTIQQLENELLKLNEAERIRLARLLFESVSEKSEKEEISSTNSLLKVAGMFSGGPGDSAERIEEILSEEVDLKHGLGKR